MQRITMKTSTIFIGKGDRTHVFHSVADVPKGLRQELDASTNGFNSATILIADRRGRQEIIRALNGLPSGLRTRLSTSLQAGSVSAEALTTEPNSATEALPDNQPLARFVQNSQFLLGETSLRAWRSGFRRPNFTPRTWAAILLPPAIALLTWAALAAR